MKWDRTKRGNVNLVQQYMAAGLSPAAAVEKAYPSWPAAKKQQLIAQMSGDSKEREELEQWQMTVKEDDPDINEKGRRLKVLQDADAKEKDHVKLAGEPFTGGTGEYTDTTFDGPTLPPGWAAGPTTPGGLPIEPDSRAKLLDHIKYMLAGGVGGATLGGLTGGGAAAGGAIGGLYGLLSDPGKDEKGKRRSRLMRALKGIVYGGGLGALGGLAGGAGAALGGYYGGKSGLRFGDSAFSERSASAMRATNRDKEAEAACRVISKVTSLVKDPKKHKWLDDSGEGFGHWAGPPSVAKGDTEPKNVKEAQKPLGEENLNLFAPNNPPAGLDPTITDRTLAAQMNDFQGLPVSAPAPAYDHDRQLRYKRDAVRNWTRDRTGVPGLDVQYPEHLGPRHPGPGGFIPSDDRMWNDEVTERRRQQVLRKPVDDPDRASDLQTLDELFFEPGAQPGLGVAGSPNPNNPSPGGVRRRYEHIYRPRDPNRREDRFGDLIKENAAKHDCDKAHPGLTHKEWKALKGQRHEIQKNAGVSREALGAILGALLGGAGGYHMANQMAEPGSMMPRFGPDGKLLPAVNPGLPGNWKEGLIGAAITGIPSAALGGYIGSALTPKDEDEEE